LPIYAVSIGVVSLTGSIPEVVAGVIYNPALGEMTSAVRGRGCYFNNKRIGSIIVRDCDEEGNKPPTQEIAHRRITRKRWIPSLPREPSPRVLPRRRGPRHERAWPAHGRVRIPNDGVGGAVKVQFLLQLGSERVGRSGGDRDHRGGGWFRVQLRRHEGGHNEQGMIMTCRPERSGEEGLLRDKILRVLRDNDCLLY
jgi:hypothetical protein